MAFLSREAESNRLAVQISGTADSVGRIFRGERAELVEQPARKKSAKPFSQHIDLSGGAWRAGVLCGEKCNDARRASSPVI